MPALPLDEAGRYVAGAYVVFVALLLIYVAIMAAKLQRIDRELDELGELAEEKSAGASDEVAVHADRPAATSEPEPAPGADGDRSPGEAGRGREAEDVGGRVPERSGGGAGDG